MEEAGAAVLQVLVQNLIDHCKKEIALIRGLEKDAAKLTGSLDTIQKFLNDAEARTIPGEAVKSWLKKLEDVAFDADNVLDELYYHILSKQIKPAEPKKPKVPSCFSCFNHISRDRNMAVRIKEINENLESINKEATELGLVGRLADVPTLVNATFETDSFTLDPIFIGRDDVALEIAEMLTNSITTDEHAVSILPIVGMGGLGKTTLTRRVFNHEMVKTRFGSHIWVHVSPNFDAVTLFKKILNNLTSSEFEIASREDILAKLQEARKDKTYLLVLDDVWNEDLSKWEDFINSLLGVTSVKGNAIVVTTRNMEVASIVNTLHIHELKALLEEECWSIIRAKALRKEDVSSEFEAIGRKIARRCQGSPLAANIVGGVLRNKSEEKWRSIEDKWLSADEGGDNITKILRLSFDNLSLPLLKKCFAYCAMFPKGCEIIKQELIEMWMAEGFLQADGRDDMESVGEKFINVLLHNSLLQVSERDYDGNVRVCGMHDLVHDLACSLPGSSSNTGGSSRVRYMNLEKNNRGDESCLIPKGMAKYLRTLLLEGDCSGINFSDFESLHVLRLEIGVKGLSSSIRKLLHLRDFDISKTWIKYLPDWVGEFFHLQTLRVSPHLRKLPSTIKYLINLRHLYTYWNIELPAGIGRLTSLQTLGYFPVGDENGCKIEELGSLNNLKGELRIRNLERVHDKEEAGKANLFKKSKILKLCLNWNGGGEGERNDENVLEGLQPHSNLKELEIGGFNGKRFPLWTQKMAVRDVPEGSWVVLNKLTSLSLIDCTECEEIPMLGHLPDLKSLVLKRLSYLKSVNSLGEWAEIEVSGKSEVKVFSFSRLEYLVINRCEQVMNVPSLGHLPNLESLELKGLSNLKCINSSFYGMVNNETPIVFPSLETLRLTEMPKLTEWAGIEVSGAGASEVKAFPRLKRLYIRNCQQLMSVPSHVSSCLEYLTISGFSVECLPADWLFSNNKTLSELDIKDCPNLRELGDSGGEQSQRSFTSLRRLEISECQAFEYLPCEMLGFSLEVLCLKSLSSLKNLPSVIIRDCPKELRDSGGEQSHGSFTSLRDLEIRECEALEYLPCEMLGFSLEKLCLESLNNLKNLPRVIDCLPKLPRLTELTIVGVPKFMATSCLEISPFPSLGEISIDLSMGELSSMETVDAILQACCHSLYSLILNGMESWECLPESIQHLNALSSLRLENFGIEELPEWLESLSSIESLILYKCKRLRRLPSIDAMQRLITLKELQIWDCPELAIQMDAMRRLTTLKELNIWDCPELAIQIEAAYSEWLEIIPSICIDGSGYTVGDVDSQENETTKQLCLSCL